MARQLSFAKNKVARRILLSFLLAAIFPVGLLGVISYQQVNDQVRSDTIESLQKNTKDYALQLLDRLILNENYLKIIAPSVNILNKNIKALDNSLALKMSHQFDDLALLTANGEITSLIKQKPLIIDISQQDLNNLSSGKTAILSIISKNSPFNQLWIAIPLEEHHPEHGTLLGEVNPETLWESEFLGLDDLWVFDATGQVLFKSKPELRLSESIVNQIIQGVSGQFSWVADGIAQLGFYWELPVNNVFAAANMVIVHSRPTALAFSSIDLFTRIYPMVICVAILIVALLSTRLINKYLTPLENLTTATVKIAEGNLNYRVNIASHDEFETLGDSFNDMTERLRNQFDIQAVMAEIDQSILSSLNADTIIDTALIKLPDILHCDLMAIIRLDSDKKCSQQIRAKRYNQAPKTLNSTLQFSAAEFADLALSPYKILTRENSCTNTYFSALGVSGEWQLLLVPIQQSQTTTALLCFVYQPTQSITAETISAANHFGDRLSVAFSNAAWEEKLYRQTHFDTLTGLPNRLVLNDSLNQELARARRDDSQVAVILIDLDHFKKVNDSLGFAAGDELLVRVADIFINSVRETDRVFRISGDEFVVVMSGLKANQQILPAISLNAEAILTGLKKPIDIGGYPITFSASLGIALFPNDADNTQGLLKNADAAMFYAKNEGRGNFKFYSQKLNEAALENITLEHDLRNAITQNGLMVYFQPKVDTSGYIVGAEALIRWKHPTLGMISPGRFIPLAEQTGLIMDIDYWVLEQVCQWLKMYITPSLKKFRVAVNISAIHFKQPDFVLKVASILTKSGVNPNNLELELTESIAIDDIDTTVQRLNQLKNLGLTLAMDDFGTGFSSLSYLEKLPLNILKIDQSFVRALGSTKTNGQAIVQTIIALAKGLEMEVIAEGVETQAQFELLKNIQCSVFQGFLFSKPLPDEEFLAVLLKKTSLIPATKSTA